MGGMTVAERVLTIGRDATCDLRFDGNQVSNLHARLIARDQRIYIEDAGSSNGTWLNGQRLKGPAPLSPGDEVGLGSMRVPGRVFIDRIYAEPTATARPYPAAAAPAQPSVPQLSYQPAHVSSSPGPGSSARGAIIVAGVLLVTGLLGVVGWLAFRERISGGVAGAPKGDAGKSGGPDATQYLGIWECKETWKMPDGHTVTVNTTTTAHVNGRENADGTLVLSVPLPNDPSMSVNVTWIVSITGSFEFRSGKLCETVDDFKFHPADQGTMDFEKHSGFSLGNLVPKGLSVCSSIDIRGNIMTQTGVDKTTTLCTRP